MSPKFCPCHKPMQKMVTNSFGKRNFMQPNVFIMFSTGSQVPKVFPNAFPKMFPIAPGVISPMVCPKFNSPV